MRSLKDLKSLKPIAKRELSKINAGNESDAGKCANRFAMPEPSRYCLSDG
ncbi:MAG: hypothetical protein AAFX87_07845 [Bacteroidota bacterium]